MVHRAGLRKSLGGKGRGDAGRAARLRGRSGVMRGMTLRAVAARRKRIGSDPYSKGQVPARANATESSAAAGAAAHKSGHAPTSGIKLMFQKQGVNSPASRRGTHITVDTAHPGQGLVRSSPPSITLTRPPPRHLLLTSSRSALARKSTRALMYMHTSRSRFWYQPTPRWQEGVSWAEGGGERRAWTPETRVRHEPIPRWQEGARVRTKKTVASG